MHELDTPYILSLHDVFYSFFPTRSDDITNTRAGKELFLKKILVTHFSFKDKPLFTKHFSKISL